MSDEVKPEPDIGSFAWAGADMATAAPVQTTTLQFYDGGTLMFTIHSDGRIERGSAFTTEDEMSLRFWQMIADAFPEFREIVRRDG